MAGTNGNGQSGFPRWWLQVISLWGMGCGTAVIVFRIDLPAFYPVIGLAIFGGVAAAGDRLIRGGRRNGDD